MASLIDLFQGLKGSSDSIPDVKADTDTLVEAELTGIRIKSAVELNNPLIYGNEAIRIANRSTRTLDDMREATTGEASSGGLIGKGISKLTGNSNLNSLSAVRNKIGDTLGIPIPLIPTRVADELEAGKSVQDVLDQKNGTEFGKFLKQTGGGTPKSIAKNALGNAISLGKDKLRGALFGNSIVIGETKTREYNYYTDTETYTLGQKYKDGSTPAYNEIETADDLLAKTEWTTGIDLAKHSPIYGVDRKSDLWETELGEQVKATRESDEAGNPLNKFTGEIPYTGKSGDADRKQSLEQRYGLSSGKRLESDPSGSDFINSISETTEYTNKLKKEYENKDLIPFWIGFVGSGDKRKTHFRALLSGISETVSPSWDSGNFFGNPYSFKTYTGIERNVTFGLKMYCMNEAELTTMWEKVNSLTKYTYPTIVNDLVNPPIIDFRLGDIYNNKIGFISSLSYTFPDDGTWEIDPKIGILPKTIDVSITIDFIEQIGTENNLYAEIISPTTEFSENSKT